VAANLGPARSGTVTIAGQTFTVNQTSGCTWTLDPTSASVAAGGGTGNVSVAAVAGCGWTAASNDAWITITSGASGSGNGTVNYAVAANLGPPRSGTVTIAGQTFTVNQASGAPAFTDDPLAARTTPVKAVHITELRAAIATLRARYSLGAYSWTDATLTAGATLVRAAHLTEMRAALNDVYDAAGRARPTYTPATISAGVTAITTTNIAELRAAVVAIW
jgi:hypothetical protein